MKIPNMKIYKIRYCSIGGSIIKVTDRPTHYYQQRKFFKSRTIKNQKINIITKNIIIVKISYRIFSLNDKSPKAIPSFQIKLIFRYFEENISDQ